MTTAAPRFFAEFEKVLKANDPLLVWAHPVLLSSGRDWALLMRFRDSEQVAPITTGKKAPKGHSHQLFTSLPSLVMHYHDQMRGAASNDKGVPGALLRWRQENWYADWMRDDNEWASFMRLKG